ncbi:MAG: cyclic nucleotide-binding domain-containing protein [Actinomycetota bacterium]
MSDAEPAQLRTVPLFAEVDDDHLERIAAAATPFEVENGYVLAERGQPGSGMFVILDGNVEVELANLDPVRLGPGEFVGELSLLTDSNRLARVRAIGPVRGLAIDRAAFRRLLHDEPRIAVAMLPVLARRLAALESDGA